MYPLMDPFYNSYYYPDTHTRSFYPQTNERFTYNKRVDPDTHTRLFYPQPTCTTAAYGSSGPKSTRTGFYGSEPKASDFDFSYDFDNDPNHVRVPRYNRRDVPSRPRTEAQNITRDFFLNNNSVERSNRVKRKLRSEPGKNNVINIPVEEAKPMFEPKPRPKIKSYFWSAVRIQKVFRGFRVRKNVGKIMELLKKLNGVVGKFQENDNIIELMKRSDFERLKVSETLMTLLLKLDDVKCVNDCVREFRKRVIKKAIMWQEWLDSLANCEEVEQEEEEDDDTLDESESDETLEGSESDETLEGSESDETLEASESDETLEGGESDETLEGSESDETLETSGVPIVLDLRKSDKTLEASNVDEEIEEETVECVREGVEDLEVEEEESEASVTSVNEVGDNKEVKKDVKETPDDERTGDDTMQVEERGVKDVNNNVVVDDDFVCCDHVNAEEEDEKLGEVGEGATEERVVEGLDLMKELNDEWFVCGGERSEASEKEEEGERDVTFEELELENKRLVKLVKSLCMKNQVLSRKVQELEKKLTTDNASVKRKSWFY